MAAPTSYLEGPRTRGAQVLAEFLPLHEEHAPMGFGERPEAAALLVADHLGDAARLAGDEGPGTRLLVAVPLTWAAATALGAVPRLLDADGLPVARAKDELLLRVDREASGLLAGAASWSACELVAKVQEALGAAFASLAAAEPPERVADGLFEVAVWAVVGAELLEGISRR